MDDPAVVIEDGVVVHVDHERTAEYMAHHIATCRYCRKDPELRATIAAWRDPGDTPYEAGWNRAIDAVLALLDER